jgi:hypothetical protein
MVTMKNDRKEREGKGTGEGYGMVLLATNQLGW